MLKGWLFHWNEARPVAQAYNNGLQSMEQLLQAYLLMNAGQTGVALPKDYVVASDELSAIFRRYTLEPAGVCAYLAIIAVDVHHIRSDLMQRIYFQGDADHAEGLRGMSIRPASTTWFELLTTHDDLADTLEALAHTGSIELELHDHTRMQMDLQDLQLRLHEYTKLERIYRTIWPEPDTGLSPFSGSSAAILDSTLARLYAWEREAQPIIQRLEVVKSRVTDLHLLHEFLNSDETADLDYSLLSTASPIISARLFLLPSKSRLENIPEKILWKEYSTSTHKFLLLVGTVDDLNGLTVELASKKNTYVHIPPLPAYRKDAVDMLDGESGKTRVPSAAIAE